MTALEDYNKAIEDISAKLKTVALPPNQSYALWSVAESLNISGTTVKNYLSGKVKNGYMAEAIYKEFKRLKMVKPNNNHVKSQ